MSLLDYFIPALFILGYQVRQLTWEGGVGGRVKGVLAKRILEQCLALQVHLMDDWDGRLEYTRTLSMALLSWQQWMNNLPGCCFAEEPCEAMLARMVARCRGNNQVSSFEDMFRLFITLPSLGTVARPTGCGLRKEMVTLIAQRVRRVTLRVHTLPFAELQGAQDATWQATTPRGHRLPTPPQDLHGTYDTVLQAALVTVCGRSPRSQDLMETVEAVFGLHPETEREQILRDTAQQTVNRWATERRRRAAGEVERQAADTARDDQGEAAAPLTEEALRAASPQAAAAGGSQQVGTVASDGGSLYEPPDTEMELSEGYQSYGDSGSLGSVGELVGDDEADW